MTSQESRLPLEQIRTRPKIFVSYARSDGRDLAITLKRDLEAEGLAVWLDTSESRAGVVWDEKIEQAIQECDIGLVLLTTGSLGSHWCKSEWQALLNAHKDVIPIRAQADVTLPMLLGPIQCLDFFNPDAYQEKLTELLECISDEKRSSFNQYTPQMTPLLPVDFVARPDELEALRTRLLSPNPGRQIAITSLTGMAGVGKSVLAQAACQDEAVRERYADGVIWIRFGRQPGELKDKVREVGRALGDSGTHYETERLAADRLRYVLRNRAVLIVLDDVWHAVQVELFRIEAPQCHVLFTARDSGIANQLGVSDTRIEVLHPAQAIQLLRTRSGRDDPAMPRIAEVLGYLPLALELAAALLDGHMSGGEWLETWDRKVSRLRRTRKSTDSHENLAICFDQSVEQLDTDEQPLYHTLGIFPEDVWIPESVVIKLWGRICPGLNEADIKETVHTLAQLNLIRRSSDGKAMILHDLLHDYNREKLGDDGPQKHRALLAAYGMPHKQVYSVTEHDDYLFYYFPYHMKEADQETELIPLLADAPNWLEMSYLKFGRNPALEQMVVRMWQSYQETAPKPAHDLLVRWLRPPLTTARVKLAAKRLFNRQRTSRLAEDSASVYTTRAVAVRCALAGRDDGAMLLALRHRDKRVRRAATVAIYSWYLDNPGHVFDSVLGTLRQQVMYRGIPRLSAAQTVLEIVTPLLIHDYVTHGIGTVETDRLLGVGRGAVRDFLQMNNPRRRPIARLLRRPVVDVGLRIILDQLRTARQRESVENAVTVINPPEVALFLEELQDEREPMRKLLPYLDRTYGDLTPLTDDILRVWDRTSYGEKVSLFRNSMMGLVIAVHGMHDPDKAWAILEAVMNFDEPVWHDVRQTSALNIWRHILIRQPKIEERWVDAMRYRTQAYYDSKTKDYGLIRSTLGIDYEYYPIAHYAEVYSSFRPGLPVDLLEIYLARAREKDDHLLLNHILRGFLSRGLVLQDLRPILKHFTPYVTSKEPETSDLAIRVLAKLRIAARDVVDHALVEARIPHQSIIEKIKSLSYGDSYDDIVSQFGDSLVLILSFMPSEKLNWLFACLRAAFAQSTTKQALSSMINCVLDTLDRNEQGVA